VQDWDDRSVRLGLVGLGWGEQIALAAERQAGVDIVACYARSSRTRIGFAARHDCAPCSSYEEMIEDESIDGIVVMTPNRAHRDQVVAALTHGKHVLVTKPIAASLEDGVDIVWASQRKEAEGVVLAVAHQSRREPALRKLKQLLEADDLGTPVLVEANISTGDGLKIELGQWRWSRDECPGGALIQLGVHHIDTLQYLFGPIVRVQSWQRRALVQADIDDVTCTLLEFETGLMGYLGSTYASSETCWIKVYGTRLNAHYDQHTGLTLSHDSWEDGPVREIVAGGMSFTPPLSTVEEELAEFVECIRTGKRPEIDAEQGLRSVAVVLAAVESGKTGKAVSVDELLRSAQKRRTANGGLEPDRAQAR
jgi:predicted dehydrogenase